MSFQPLTATDVAEAPWPAELTHLSASSLKMFFRCPESWRRRYVLGEKIAPGAALIQGRADHTAIEHNFRSKLVTGEDVSVADVQMVFAEEVDREIEEAGGAAEVDFGKRVKGKLERRKAAGEMKDSGVRLVTAYRVQECPRFEPAAVEEAFTLNVPGVPVEIQGRVDLIGNRVEHFFGQAEPTRGPTVIVDRKTTGRTAKTPDPEWRVQAGIYMLHRWVPMHFHLSVKTKEPKIVTPEQAEMEGLVLKPSPLLHRQITMQMHHLVRGIGVMYATYGPDQVWDGAILHTFACDYCGYRDDPPDHPCAWWHNPNEVAARIRRRDERTETS